MADKKVDEAAVRRELDALAGTWRQISSRHGPPVVRGPTGTRLFEGLSDLRRKLSRMMDAIADHVAKVNKSSFSYSPNLAPIRPPGPSPAPLTGNSVYINLERAEQLRAALRQSAGSFGQHRSRLNTLFFTAPGGAPPMSALQTGGQRCGELSNDLRLRIEYARAADKISFFGQGHDRAAAFTDFRSPSEAQTAVNQAKANLAARQAAQKQQEGTSEKKGLFGRITGKAKDWSSRYATGVYEAAGEMGKEYWKYSPPRIIFDNDGWRDDVKTNWKTLKYAVQNPVDFSKESGKALIDWKTWKEDPARAAGHLATAIASLVVAKKVPLKKPPNAKTPTDTTPDTPELQTNAPEWSSGARQRPRDLLDDPAQRRWAEEAYKNFTQNDRDIDAITDHLKKTSKPGEPSFTRTEIAEIKEHVFRRSHPIEDYETGKIVHRRFDADEDMASAWIRLRSGRALPHDVLLLRHELAELNYLKRKPGATYREAHQHANKKFNWQNSDLPKQLEDIDSDW